MLCITHGRNASGMRACLGKRYSTNIQAFKRTACLRDRPGRLQAPENERFLTSKGAISLGKTVKHPVEISPRSCEIARRYAG